MPQGFLPPTSQELSIPQENSPLPPMSDLPSQESNPRQATLLPQVDDPTLAELAQFAERAWKATNPQGLWTLQRQGKWSSRVRTLAQLTLELEHELIAEGWAQKDALNQAKAMYLIPK